MPVFLIHPRGSNHLRAILLSAYALLTFSLLSATPLWLDELLQLNLAWERSLKELLPWMEIQPGAVPLPYVVQQLALRVLGHSAFAARFCAALFSILAGAAFVAVCNRIPVRRKALALALFLFTPLQFRYALEARGYSQGLFFAIATMWVFLEWMESPSLKWAALYFGTVAVGMYFHPFLAFPVAAQLFTAPRKQIWIAGLLGGACFVPWLILQYHARQSYVSPSLYPVGHVTPLVVLHELTGGGYVPTLCLLFLAGFGALHRNVADISAPVHRLLWVSAILSIAGPLAADVVFHYFFAGRQFLIALPALVLLAAHGFDRLWKRHRLLAAVPALAFLAIALVEDWRQATIPRDDLAVSAQAVAAHMSADACVLTAPAWARDYYAFFRRDVVFPACGDPPASARVLLVVSPTSTTAERESTLSHLAGGYVRANIFTAGKSELGVYRRVGGKRSNETQPASAASTP